MIVRWTPVAAFLIPAMAIAANPAADKPILAPPAAWVHPAPLPADTAKPDQSALRLLLSDSQSLLQPNGAETYSETVVKVQTAQGLSALGTIALPWKPDNGTLTVHKLNIVRDGKVIDLLAKGPGFTVVRRENNLEYAMLDGILTAVIQPEGLQVGDILDMATTVSSHDPALGGNSEAFVLVGPGMRAARYQARLLWPDTLPVHWRQGDGMPVHVRKAGGQTELSLAMDDVQPQILPKDAPPRFAITRQIEATSLKSWNELSDLFAPLYTRAAELKPDSPLQAEIARIAAASPDPVRRAEAALALTQDKIRYVFLGMNDGNLVPAEADITWQRRFADCKGKTAFLLALLHSLGIEAAPALVSTGMGDGMDERLPEVGLFNHVIVRATIGGKTYWLDGTRVGDVRLADIRVPDFGYALPLRNPGVGLEKLDVPVPAKPLAEYAIKVDMRGGVSQPYPFHVEELSRGDDALTTHLRLENLTADVLQQSLRDYFAREYPDVEPKTYSAAWDPATGEEKLVMDGIETHDWRWAYEADHAAIGWKADFARAPGAYADAPFQVDYPAYTVAHETILLPNKGVGMINYAPDIERTVAGVEYYRKATLENGVFTIDTRTRATAREFPAKDAPAAQAALRDLAAQEPLLGINHGLYQNTPQEQEAAVNDPKSASDYYQRAALRLTRKDYAGALTDLDKVAELGGAQNPAPYFMRGTIYSQQEKYDLGLAEVLKGVAIAPSFAPGHAGLALLYMQLQRNDEALAEVNRAIALGPGDYRALAMRAELNRRLRHYDQGLADSDAALKLKTDDPNLYQTRVNLFMAQHQPDKALAAAQAGVAANPKSEFAHTLLGATYAKLKHPEEAMAEFGKAIAISPTPETYLTRANNRPEGDIAGRRADIAAVLKLDPTQADALEMSIALEMKLSNFSAVIPAATAALAKKPGYAPFLVDRGVAYARTHRPADADKDFSAARAAAGSDGPLLNSACWTKATYNVALESALADCEAALKLQADQPAFLDSRGFVLLRLGRYADSIASYDRALGLRSGVAESLYGRGLAKRGLGKATEGQADLSAAREIDRDIDQKFAGYGFPDLSKSKPGAVSTVDRIGAAKAGNAARER
jgi:tetratricopeptide (TPR) repeat protein